MLLRKGVLEDIAAGRVDLVFRKWKRPTVKGGGSLRTAIGMLEIGKVEAVRLDEISEDDARRAGLHLDELILDLEQRDEGEIYRIEVGLLGPDPRVALREDEDLSEDDIARLIGRLERLDRASARGAWTRTLLELIEENPHVRAHDLADVLGLDKTVFKNDVRKLKALGLTISHSPGYELSPRGTAFLRRTREHRD